MTAKYDNDYGVLQSGYWKLEIDTLHPRVVSLRTDASGWGEYSDEMLVEGLGGMSVSETEEGIFNCRTSQEQAVTASLEKEMVLSMKDVRVGDFALVDLRFALEGEKGEILKIEVDRRLMRPVELITDVPFGFHLKRLFSLWSRPDLRFGHNPDEGYRTHYSPFEERRKRRVIGYHGIEEMLEFVVHSAPGFPDFSIKVNTGFYHIEQRYCQYALVGVSSRDFKGGPVEFAPGSERWTLEFRVIPQGTLAPVTYESSNPLVDRFVREFFDGHLLSAVAADHEFFGNNPYRHCYCPLPTLTYTITGFMVTDRAKWSAIQGDMESRWRNLIRRTLSKGRINPERLIILFDSGVWQDACGAVTHEGGSPASNSAFVVGCCWHLLKTGDREFALEIMPELETLLRPLVRLQSEKHEGLLINTLPGTPFGTPGAAAGGYNDCLSVGHMDMYLNVSAFDAFLRFAGLLEYLGEIKRAEEYRTRAVQISMAVNKYLWNESGGRYVGWIDTNGKIHDFWFTDINFYAFSAGLVPEDRSRKMLSSFLSHPNHHLLFAAGVNLDPITDGSLVAPIQFGECIHGTLYPGPMAEELVFRARVGGAECAWEMLGDVIKQWEKDHLYREPLFQDWACHHPHIFEWWQRYTGKASYSWLGDKGPRGAATEPYLSDGGAMLWAMYNGVLGICPDFKGVTFRPHIPKVLANGRDVKVSIRIMGRKLDIRYRGYGDHPVKLQIAGRDFSSNRILWRELPERTEFEIQAGPIS